MSPAHLDTLIEAETARFVAARPKSAALAREAAEVWWGGTPMHWMGDWATPFPIFAERGEGARLFDVDGHAYDDFCLGDTPAMFGHGEPRTAEAVERQARRGLSFMLPTAGAVKAGRRLAARFGLEFWQTAVTATDANRAALRWARAITGRPKVLVFDGCYHGALDEVLVALGPEGETLPRPGLVGPVLDVAETTRVVPFNDLEALRAALAHGDVAAVLAEPVMTNCGMILPAPWFHAALRDLTRRTGTLLILDETHSWCTGSGGYTGAYGLQPDMFVLGKAVAGGVPAAVWGFTGEVADRMRRASEALGPGQSGIGTTLSGGALGLAAIEAVLDKVATPQAFETMLAGAARLTEGVGRVIAARGLGWSTPAVGARVELVFADPAPRDAAGMRAALGDGRLARALHLFLINRGVLIAPFHTMMLVSPVTGEAQIDRLVAAVDEFAAVLHS